MARSAQEAFQLGRGCVARRRHSWRDGAVQTSAWRAAALRCAGGRAQYDGHIFCLCLDHWNIERRRQHGGVYGRSDHPHRELPAADMVHGEEAARSYAVEVVGRSRASSGGHAVVDSEQARRGRSSSQRRVGQPFAAPRSNEYGAYCVHLHQCGSREEKVDLPDKHRAHGANAPQGALHVCAQRGPPGATGVAGQGERRATQEGREAEAC
mmetsp:Transcript_8751/g.26301  ORF Transcript_8751/g.26301 Transcript_8751/m.26301 type:complete len:210 (+) Transcript_8751:176-805(+)